MSWDRGAWERTVSGGSPFEGSNSYGDNYGVTYSNPKDNSIKIWREELIKSLDKITYPPNNADFIKQLNDVGLNKYDGNKIVANIKDIIKLGKLDEYNADFSKSNKITANSVIKKLLDDGIERKVIANKFYIQFKNRNCPFNESQLNKIRQYNINSSDVIRDIKNRILNGLIINDDGLNKSINNIIRLKGKISIEKYYSSLFEKLYNNIGKNEISSKFKTYLIEKGIIKKYFDDVYLNIKDEMFRLIYNDDINSSNFDFIFDNVVNKEIDKILIKIKEEEEYLSKKLNPVEIENLIKSKYPLYSPIFDEEIKSISITVSNEVKNYFKYNKLSLDEFSSVLNNIIDKNMKKAKLDLNSRTKDYLLNQLYYITGKDKITSSFSNRLVSKSLSNEFINLTRKNIIKNMELKINNSTVSIENFEEKFNSVFENEVKNSLDLMNKEREERITHYLVKLYTFVGDVAVNNSFKEYLISKGITPLFMEDIRTNVINIMEPQIKSDKISEENFDSCLYGVVNAEIEKILPIVAKENEKAKFEAERVRLEQEKVKEVGEKGKLEAERVKRESEKEKINKLLDRLDLILYDNSFRKLLSSKNIPDAHVYEIRTNISSIMSREIRSNKINDKNFDLRYNEVVNDEITRILNKIKKEENASKKICPNCNHSNGASAKFCSNCGIALVKSSNNTKSNTKINNKTNIDDDSKWKICCLGIIIILAIIAIMSIG